MTARIPIDRILSELRQFPHGVTTKELAEHLRMSPTQLASRLGKAFMYGHGVGRTERPQARLIGREFVWRAE